MADETKAPEQVIAGKKETLEIEGVEQEVTVHKLSDVRKVRIKYPKDYKGKKHFKDGTIVEVHAIEAKHWVEVKGIAELVKEK